MRLRRNSRPSPEGETLGEVAVPAATVETDEVPCTPCEEARKARQFSLNPPPAVEAPDDAVPVVSPAVTTDVGDEGVDLVIADAPVFTLNATAGLIWLTIDGHLDVAGIVADLADEIGAPAEQIGPDVRSTIATFAAQGLVTLAPSS